MLDRQQSITPEFLLERIGRADDAGCWPWLGGVTGEGYGTVYGLGAHRLVYELFVGPIADGLTIDHLCRRKDCVNPQHLEPVTIQVNIKRRGEAMQTCRKGHAFDERNTARDARGNRRCRRCVADNQLAYQRRKRAGEAA